MRKAIPGNFRSRPGWVLLVGVVWVLLLAGCRANQLGRDLVMLAPTGNERASDNLENILSGTHEPTLATPKVPQAVVGSPTQTVLSIQLNNELTPTKLLNPTATQIPTKNALPTVTPTADKYAGLGIEDLVGRSYGGGRLEIQETLAINSYFTRTLITYPSDNLTIYGFMNIPSREVQSSQSNDPSGNQAPAYPVIIALHGYIEPSIYQTLDYTTRYADALARAGFLVIHPNLRGYPPSDEGENLFRVGMAIDVLNLIAIIQEQAGEPGPLERADPEAIGVWGHSMGGGIATRVITVSPVVRAALLYGAMSGDERKNFERIYTYFSNGARGWEELQAPEEVFRRISPIYFLDRIQAAVSIHHGKNDPDVPLAWSLDLCQRLEELDRPVECFTYPNQGHTFHDDGDDLFIQRMVEFFTRQLIYR